MLSLLKNLLTTVDAEKQKREMQEKFEQEQLHLEAELDQEESLAMESPMHNVIGVKTNLLDNANDSIEKSDCSKRVGVITTLKSNHGTIDHGIFFDINVALTVHSELKVGSRVDYLAYQSSNSDFIKVVKIERVIDPFWDDAIPTEEKIEEQIAELKNKKPEYFNTHQRNILGLITERKRESILIDTDYKTMNVNLDAVEINFVPKVGDRVVVCCNVQSDEHFVDKQGEILQEVSVNPSRILKQEKCTVRKIHSEWGELNEETYFTFDVLPSACKLNVGDIVHADLIECEMRNYVWRCIRLSIVERFQAPYAQSSAAPTQLSRSGNQAVSITDDIRCIFTSTFEKKEFEVNIKNNCDRKLVVQSIEFPGKRRDSIMCLIDPNILDDFPFTLLNGESRSLRFEAESKSYGATRESFVINFGTFRVRRSVEIVVYEGEEAAAAAKEQNNKENLVAASTASYSARSSIQRSRHYANQVWSKKSEVVPGVGMAPKRRFIAQRIQFYEVPERMRDSYLTCDKRTDMFENIEGMFPCLKEDLKISNYTRRFQTLLHLEEIEYFVNFRNYDRERAHFTRDGEFLSLIIENLAERRPSLVLGDVVRAINPWSDTGTSDTRSFDGVIHKVLFNRVLLKFNSGFQSKYNGEDYRLEFYFSRYGFRKQHFGVNRIVKHLGESFLFPSKMNLRENLQLDITLDEENNLRLHDTPLKWYNTQLNTIQKRAIHNILRGETQKMPYVIFGPPGTGKTITLVETILKLIKILPSSRLLVGAPSNSSADLITTRIIESGILQPGDFVRLVSQNQVEKDLIPQHLMTYCATVDIAADGTCDDAMIVTESGLKLKCQMKYLGRHRVTISTCTTLGNFLQMGFPPAHFTHVLIDESGQCTEPEVMVAISQVSESRGQVILAGDPHQLQAIVINRYAGDRGLSLSFLERILQRAPYFKDIVRYPETYGYDPRLVTKLINNYRALPSILNVYNELFYDSELEPQVGEYDSRESKLLQQLDSLLPKSSTRAKTHGAFFNGVRSENMQEKDSPSWYNPVEAKNVFLMTIQLYRKNIQPECIGIITPYMKQVKHLRSLFTTADIAMPKIGSVEEFQGQERDIILISTVRSTQKLIVNDLRHSLGFVQCPKRMNVAISRARYLMFVFGNPHLLSLDNCWRAYIKYCVDNDAYLGCDLPEHIESLHIEQISLKDNDDESAKVMQAQ